VIEFYVRGEVLAAIKLFAATADIRTYLNGVCFEVGPSEVRLIATDGVMLFAATADIRTYLNGVCFEVGPSEVRLIATDGVMLGVFRVDYEPPALTDTVFQAIVPPDLLRNVKGKVPVLVALGEPEGEDNTRRVEVTPAGGATTVGRTIARLYPDYRRVIPGEVSGETAQFNLRYIETLRKAYSALHGTKPIPAIGIGHNGQGCALLTPDDEDFVGVLTPLREGGKAITATAPTWAHDRTLAAPASGADDLV